MTAQMTEPPTSAHVACPKPSDFARLYPGTPVAPPVALTPAESKKQRRVREAREALAAAIPKPVPAPTPTALAEVARRAKIERQKVDARNKILGRDQIGIGEVAIMIVPSTELEGTPRIQIADRQDEWSGHILIANAIAAGVTISAIYLEPDAIIDDDLALMYLCEHATLVSKFVRKLVIVGRPEDLKILQMLQQSNVRFGSISWRMID